MSNPSNEAAAVAHLDAARGALVATFEDPTATDTARLSACVLVLAGVEAGLWPLPDEFKAYQTKEKAYV